MKRVLFIFLLFFSSVYADRSLLQNLWKDFLSDSKNEKVLELAHEITYHETKSDQEKVDKLLNDYSSDESLEDALKSFVRGELKVDYKLGVVAIQKHESSDRDHANVFFIYKMKKDKNKDPELITVIKTYPRVCGLAHELAGLDKLYSLKLKKSSTVAPLGIGKADIRKRTSYFLALSIASGQTLSELAEELQGFIGRGREKQFKKFNQGIRKLAEAIAELHQAYPKNSHSGEYPSHLAWMLESFTTDTQKILNKKHINIKSNKVEKFFEELDEHITLHYPSRFCTHGDLNWNNIFYDAKKDRITLIDVTSFREWDYENEEFPALYRALRDYSAAFTKITSPSYGLLKSEKERLTKDYLETFSSKGIAQAKDKKLVEIFWKAAALHGLFHCHSVSLKHHHKETKEPLNDLKIDLKDLKKLRDEFRDHVR